ncbi:MAG TPA: dihydrofolate reductase family protein [Edaphobacter sp.]|nr:dihydrofolate reductase family protein [Edaphobacter sp.]
MRKLKLSLACSLDGYIAGVDGSFDWIRMDADYGMEAFLAAVDTALIGRKTFEMARSVGRPFFSSMENYVFSKSLPAGRDGEVEVVGEDAGVFVRVLKQREGKDLWLFGGQGLAASLLIAGEVDEVTLAVQPILLGEGLRLFPVMGERTALEMLECTSYKNGVAVLRYAVRR